MADGWGVNEIVAAYSHVTPEDILAAVAFPANVLRRKPFVTVAEIEVSVGEEGGPS
jgi:uncharacterized protein (DUF433 family)